MKHIDFGGGRQEKEPVRIWKPLTFLSWFGRFLVFLLILGVTIFLMSFLFKGCSHDEREDRLKPVDPPIQYPSPILGTDDSLPRYKPNPILPPIFREGDGDGAKGGERDGDSQGKGVDPVDNPFQLPDPPISPAPRKPWNPSIVDPSLPNPDDNIIPMPKDDDWREKDGRYVISNQLYVILNAKSDDDTFVQWAHEFTALYHQPEYSIVYYNTLAKTLVLQVPEADRERMIAELPHEIVDIDFYVTDVSVMQPSLMPNDPAFSEKEVAWYFDAIQAYDAWDITTGSSDIVIGIIDSYFDLNHEEFSGKQIVHPYSFERQNEDVAPYSDAHWTSAGHGSLVASVATGRMNNKKGASGIAPKCTLMPVSLGQSLTTINMAEAILYCIYNGADVINLSMGTIPSESVKRMSYRDQIKLSEQKGKTEEAMWDYVFKLADERNVVIVWSAGNDNVYTALDNKKRNGHTIKVSAVDRDLTKASFSNYGNFDDLGAYQSTISAPGVDIFGALPGNNYDMWPGTSFSAPIVTGAVALMKSINPNLKSSEIIEILKKTGKPVKGAPEIGNLIQIKDALLAVRGEFVSEKELTKNPNSIIGLWESTILLPVTENGVPTGEKVKILFDIQSGNVGSVRLVETTSMTFDTPMTWSLDGVNLSIYQEHGARSSETDRTFVSYNFKGSPDEDGLLLCIGTQVHDLGQTREFYIRKIK